MDDLFEPRIMNSASINKHVRSVFNRDRAGRFSQLQLDKRTSMLRNRYFNRLEKSKDLLMDAASIGLRGIGGMGVAAMGIGMYGVQSSFDRSMNQNLVKGALDIFVSEAPQLASFAVFGAAEKIFTGKLGEGAAGGFFRRALGVKGGGIAGKGAAFAGAFATAMLSTELLRPMQEALGGAIARERSSGLLSSIAKGSQAEVQAVLKDMGITSTKNLPKTIQEMTNKQMLQAQRELKSTVYDTGFWGALGSGKLIKWSEQSANEEAQKNIRISIQEAGSNLYHAMDQNNRMIIEFYSRE